jgi:hypothetical protein
MEIEKKINIAEKEENKITCEVESEKASSDKLDTQECEEEETSSSENSNDSNEEIQEAAADEPPMKRRRRRKRRTKKKKNVTTAYVPDEPFKMRYNNLPAFLNAAAPKIHLRFDSQTGDTDQNKSEFNYKARIIKALEKNLSLKENFKDVERNLNHELMMLEETQEIPTKFNDDGSDEIICRKPRIIKAIGY